MKPKPEQKRDRRARADRRARTRGGRRNLDRSHKDECPACASTQIDRAPAKHGLVELQCRACSETWVAVSKARSA